MRSVCRVAAALLAVSIFPSAATLAQAAPPSSSLPAVPTTKVLAIGSVVAPPSGAPPQASIMPAEVSATVRLYLSGKIDQWYVRRDTRGVVFLMNVSSVDEAHQLLEKLPLGVAGIMKFELIPVGPLSPLNYLLPPEAKPAE